MCHKWYANSDYIIIQWYNSVWKIKIPISCMSTVSFRLSSVQQQVGLCETLSGKDSNLYRDTKTSHSLATGVSEPDCLIRRIPINKREADQNKSQLWRPDIQVWCVVVSLNLLSIGITEYEMDKDKYTDACWWGKVCPFSAGHLGCPSVTL